MPVTAFKWQLYIATYTAMLGVPFLFFPKLVLPYINFDPAMVDEGPFVRLTGMFLLCLTLVTFRIWQKKIDEMILGTVFLRLFILIVLITVGIRENFPFLHFMSVVVGIGVAGTLWSVRHTDLKQYL